MRDDLFLHNVNPEFFLQDVKPEKLSFSSLYRSSLFSAILHFAPFENWGKAWHVDGLKRTSGVFPFYKPDIFLQNMIFFSLWPSVKDHLFMPHVRPLKLAGGGEVVKVQNYFNAFIKLSHPLTKFTIPQAISDLYSLLITLLALEIWNWNLK